MCKVLGSLSVLTFPHEAFIDSPKIYFALDLPYELSCKSFVTMSDSPPERHLLDDDSTWRPFVIRVIRCQFELSQ